MRIIVLRTHWLCAGARVPTHSYLASFFNGRELDDY